MRVAVFCGSNFGKSDIYRESAVELGRALAARGNVLVFGGTNKGLMKVVADAALDAGGEIHGVIPRNLVEKGQQHPKLTVADVVADRAVRKVRMAEVADAFIAMPGGIGTIEELFDMWVDAQFDGHKKPLGLYNVDGFFDGILAFIDSMIARGFLPPQQKDMLIVEAGPDALLDRFGSFTPITVSKWM